MHGNLGGNRYEFCQNELELFEFINSPEARRKTNSRNRSLEVIESLEYLDLHSNEKKRHDRLKIGWHPYGILLGSHHELRTCVPSSLKDTIEFA